MKKMYIIKILVPILLFVAAALIIVLRYRHPNSQTVVPNIIPPKSALIKVETYSWTDWVQTANERETIIKTEYYISSKGDKLKLIDDEVFDRTNEFLIAELSQDYVIFTPLGNSNQLEDSEYNVERDNKGEVVKHLLLMDTKITQGKTWVLQTPSNDGGLIYKVTVIKINNQIQPLKIK